MFFRGLSNISNHVDAAMLYIVGISLILLVGVTGTMLYFVFRYNRKRNPVAEEVSGNLGLEITWTILPTILVIFIFWVGYSGYALMRTIPKDNLPVKVTARQWSWLFTYENGKSSDKLVVPEGRAIKLSITSQDVLHSLFIPAFRVKEDAVPGMVTKLWFIPEKIGKYDLFCTEYCGVGHSKMITKVVVLAPKEFDKWYASAGTGGKEQMHPGEKLLRDKGCLGCHTTDGSKLIGPSFKGLLGSRVTVVTGGKERTVTADAEYIERSIKEPGSDVVKGFSPVMPTIPVTGQEIHDIIDYLGTLTGKAPARHEQKESEKQEEKAHEQKEETKTKQGTQATPLPDGHAVLTKYGCLNCHTTDGSKLVGPSFKGIMGHKVTVLTGGKERTVTADAEYIERSIHEPNADVVKGFQPMMPPLPLSDTEIQAVVNYLGTLK